MEVSPLGGASPAELRLLVATVGPRADQTPYPTLGSYLPVAGRVPNSDKYILGPASLQSAISQLQSSSRELTALASGDWIGFANGAEAALGQYRSGPKGADSVLLLVEYPTYQIAAEKLKEIEKRFPRNGSETPQIVSRRKGSLLSVIFEPKSVESANALLGEVRYETQVTWNEPTHQFKEPSIEVMIVGAFIGTGVILMFAVVAGLGFGGLRLITKYLLPGKVFDRREHVEILQLGISSKPIEGRDFY
jgi:hypothetical protein